MRLAGVVYSATRNNVFSVGNFQDLLDSQIDILRVPTITILIKGWIDVLFGTKRRYFELG
jgi:hypothetical protein